MNHNRLFFYFIFVFTIYENIPFGFLSTTLMLNKINAVAELFLNSVSTDAEKL